MIPQRLSKSVENFTPAFVVDAVREGLGGIDLDPKEFFVRVFSKIGSVAVSP